MLFRLSDLAHAAHNGTIYCQRIIAGVFLELAFNSHIRMQMASMNTPGTKTSIFMFNL